MNIKLKSLKSNFLKKNEKIAIFKIKNSHWSSSIKEQEKWFYDNINKNDIHNLLYLNDTLIGYNSLRKITNDKLKKTFLLFDTVVIKQKLRKSKFGTILMIFNNLIIKEKKLPAILLCDKKKIKFYEKNNWRLKKKNFKKKHVMIFNEKKINSNQIFLTLNTL
jgi:hypothetical protein